MLAYINTHDYPVENFLYLYVLLALWDPWHFLLQHYGFMRIYDRHNAAPKKLAARMDLALSATWFVFIMLASGEWLASILEDLFLTANVPLAAVLPSAAIDVLTYVALAAACAATVAYGVYLVVVPAPGLLREPREARAVRDDVRRDVHRLHAEPVDPVVGAGVDVHGRLRRDRHRAHDAVPRDRVALQPQPRCAAGARARRLVSRAARAAAAGSSAARTCACAWPTAAR